MSTEEKTFNYDEEKKRIDQLLDLFQQDLEASGLSEKTIRGHIANAELFLVHYNLNREEEPLDTSLYHIGMFISYFFIRKCLWSTPSSVKSTVASIKKLAKTMLAHGYIDQEDYDDFKEEVKWNTEEWVEECRIFNGGGSSYYDF